MPMPRLIIIPGYGDRVGYIYKLTKRWPRRFGVQVEVATFGWRGDPRTYQQKWQAFLDVLNKGEPATVLGISAGASVALRALQQQPQQVRGVISVCGPRTANFFNPKVLARDYPTLSDSLHALPSEPFKGPILTLRPLYDESVPTKAVTIQGARNVRMPFVFHAPSIVLALALYGRTICKFVKNAN